MHKKKKRTKDRRRAKKLSQQAWEAADAGNLDLALKMIGRANDADPGNPVYWHDKGWFQQALDDFPAAIQSFQAALILAPDFAEVYSLLASSHARQGNLEKAKSLQQNAVSLNPASARFRSELEVLNSIDGQADVIVAMDTPCEPQPHDAPFTSNLVHQAFENRIEQLDWFQLESRMTRTGIARINELLTPSECQQLRMMFDDDSIFSKTVKMDKSRFGNGVYRYFHDPVPDPVQSLRKAIFPHLATIANRWQALLGNVDSYPDDWEQFRQQCAMAGQCSPSPLLLKYETDGFNALHQDIRGEIFFPIQMVVVLSPTQAQADSINCGFIGGDFLFCDAPFNKQANQHAISAGLGDAILFCTRHRLSRIAGQYGLQSVKHGIDIVKSGTRYAIGLPFHEFE